VDDQTSLSLNRQGAGVALVLCARVIVRKPILSLPLRAGQMEAVVACRCLWEVEYELERVVEGALLIEG
jgi:hypothetical protein